MAERDVWIPMPDGIRLAATLFEPDVAPPWPAILEALPYRKDDLTRSYASEHRRLAAEGGYAVCRLDLRGTGTSEGRAGDEYPPQEQRDLCEVIAWLAARPWCTGAVAMYGTSYSGFNSLQAAMERPPALRAVAALSATDDRYTDDVHYGGGVRRALDLLDYPLYMVAMNALPPVPRLRGPGWREAWRERVEGLEPWLLRWAREQTDGPYWRHGSLAPDYGRITCPVMIVAGWADGYRNATFRTFAGLRAPKRLLIGPWSHASPASARPGPHIDPVPELLRWFDRWCRDERNGVDEEPPIAVFVRRSTRPAFDLAEMRGEWRFEPAWPPARLREEAWPLPAAAGSPGGPLAVAGDVGSAASIWCAGHLPFGQPEDQRPDEARSLVHDWAFLTEDLEILGHPRVELTVRSSAPVAFLSAKLCDVLPDGTSALVSRGILNLTHRGGHDAPRPLPVGEPVTVRLELDATSWVFEPGHRVRLDLAGADWPNVWPPPEPSTLEVDRSSSTLTLPVLPGPARAGAPSFAGPREEPEPLAPGPRPVWRVERDAVAGESRVVIEHGGETLLEDGSLALERYRGVVGVRPDAPGTAWAEGSAAFELRWEEATVGTEARVRLRSDPGAWDLEVALDVSEGGEVRWRRRWEARFPRDLA